MATKGTSLSCCCIGCDSPPFENTGTEDSDIRDPIPQKVQYLCMACMPLQLCLLVTCADVPQPALLQRVDPCHGDPYHTYSYWSGFVSLGSSSAVFTVFFDTVGDDCYLCLECASIGITGSEPGSRVLITDAVRRQFSPSCQDCQNQLYPTGPVTWNFPIPGGLYCSIIATPVSNISLTITPPCAGCPDPCANQTDYASVPAPTCRACLGCDCVCEFGCVTIKKNGNVFFSGSVAMCNFAYSLPTGDAISLMPNATTKACELWLTSLNILDPGDSWPDGTFPQAINIVGQCPDMVASWTLTTTLLVHVSVYFACAECGTCDELKFAPCCPNPLPRLLHATFDGSACGCGPPSIVVPIYDSTITGEAAWIGCSEEMATTDHCLISQLCIKLFCSNGVFILNVSYTGPDGVFYESSTADYGNSGHCLPFQLKFTNVYFAGTGYLCRPPLMLIPLTYTVTVNL